MRSCVYRRGRRFVLTHDRGYATPERHVVRCIVVVKGPEDHVDPSLMNSIVLMKSAKGHGRHQQLRRRPDPSLASRRRDRR